MNREEITVNVYFTDTNVVLLYWEDIDRNKHVGVIVCGENYGVFVVT